jgi:hypothetical protein
MKDECWKNAGARLTPRAKVRDWGGSVKDA